METHVNGNVDGKTFVRIFKCLPILTIRMDDGKIVQSISICSDPPITGYCCFNIVEFSLR